MALAMGALLPALALAHPLGNFTINHYAGIRVEPDRVVLDVVVDQAEIPTFQEKLRIDTDGDGSVSDAETEAERVAACPVLAGSLTLNVARPRSGPGPGGGWSDLPAGRGRPRDDATRVHVHGRPARPAGRRDAGHVPGHARTASASAGARSSSPAAG